MVTVREQLPGRLNELSEETTVEHAEQAQHHPLHRPLGLHARAGEPARGRDGAAGSLTKRTEFSRPAPGTAAGRTTRRGQDHA